MEKNHFLDAIVTFCVSCVDYCKGQQFYGLFGNTTTCSFPQGPLFPGGIASYTQ